MKRMAGRHKGLADIEQLTKKMHIKKTDQVNETQLGWSVTFDQGKEAQLRDMLKSTPASKI